MSIDRQSGAGTNQEAVRRHNLGTLLGHVHHREQISRAELTSRMKLNRSTIAGLVGELEALQVVEQTNPTGERTGAGRPSLDVRPGRHEVFVIAIELRVDMVSAARVGLGGHVLDRAVAAASASHEPRDVARTVAELIRRLLADAPRPSSLVGIGGGLPGVVGVDTGMIAFAPNLAWTDVPFAQLLRDEVGDLAEITLGNDADLGVLSEHIRGAGAGFDDVVYLAGDVGVGGGVIAGGRALQGSGGYAGEVGHMRTKADGRDCRCGSSGCWETEIGAAAVAAAVGCRPEDLDVLAARLGEVDEPSEALVRVGHELGVGLGNIVNLFNPKVIILGGLLRDVYPVVLGAADRAMQAGALSVSAEQTAVVLPALGGDSVLLGAAELAFGPLLMDPARVLQDAAAAQG